MAKKYGHTWSYQQLKKMAEEDSDYSSMHDCFWEREKEGVGYWKKGSGDIDRRGKEKKIESRLIQHWYHPILNITVI